MVPRGHEHAEHLAVLGDFGLTDDSRPVVPRTGDDVETLFLKELHAGPRLAFLRRAILPVANDDVFRKSVEQAFRLRAGVGDVAGELTPGNEHVVPEHGTTAALGEKVG